MKFPFSKKSPLKKNETSQVRDLVSLMNVVINRHKRSPVSPGKSDTIILLNRMADTLPEKARREMLTYLSEVRKNPDFKLHDLVPSRRKIQEILKNRSPEVTQAINEFVEYTRALVDIRLSSSEEKSAKELLIDDLIALARANPIHFRVTHYFLEKLDPNSMRSSEDQVYGQEPLFDLSKELDAEQIIREIEEYWKEKEVKGKQAAKEAENLDQAKRYLRPTEKPKIKDPKKIRVLIKTVKKGKFEKVKRLVEEGVDVNKPDNKGKTPLWWAIYIGDIEIAKLLLEKGADVDKPDNKGKTPLWWAIHKGYIDTTKLLIENGADVNKPALWWAINGNNIEIAKLLLEKGAKPTSKDLKTASQMGNETIIQLLEVKMAGAGVMGAMESALGQKPPVAKRAIPLEPKLFARLQHKGRPPIREVPSATTPPKEIAAQLIVLGSDSLDHDGDIQSAEKNFKKALELEPDNITALTNLGFVLCKQGKYRLAEIPFIEALRLCSDVQESAKIHMNLAIALFMQKKIQSAENQVKATLKINPNDADAQKLLELIIAKQRKSDEGRFQATTRKQIRSAVKPETSSGTQPAEKSIPASSSNQSFGLPKPDETPKKSIMEEITSAERAIALANSSAEENDYESARIYLKKAIEIDPYNELAHRNLGFVYEMLASIGEEKENKNIYLRKAKEHIEKADRLKATAEKQADKEDHVPTNGQIDELFRPFDNGPFDNPPEPQPSPPQPQPANQASDVQPPGLRGQERGDTKEELDSSKERLKDLCKVILDKPPSYTGWQKAVEGYLALISHNTNLYIKSVNHRAVAIKLREAYKSGHFANNRLAIVAHTQDVLINKKYFEALKKTELTHLEVNQLKAAARELFKALAEAGLTHLEANQFKAAVILFKDILSLNLNLTDKEYAWVKKCLEELKAKMLTPPAPEAEQEEFECPPTVVKQDSSQLQPGEEQVKIEVLPKDQVPEQPVPDPFTDDEWAAAGQLNESDETPKDHEQGRPPFVPTLPSIKVIPEMAETERKLKLTEIQQQFTAGSRTFASIVANFKEISPEQMDELNKWVKRYTKLLLENPKAHFPHDATRKHLISMQERGWVSNEAMMDFMKALKKYEGPKKAK